MRTLAELICAAAGRLCRQLWLLAGVILLCTVLPVLAGRGAQQRLSQGVSFSGITLAVTAPEGDGTPQLLERYLGQLTDIRQYCTFEAMAYQDALSALESGGVTAVLVLPEDFVQGVQNGENPAVRLIVDGNHPLESMLTLWVGESASQLLAAVQSGIYAVLEQYDRHPVQGLRREDVVTQINLDYIHWTVNRQTLFLERKLTPTGVLPVGLHYTLSLFWFLVLSAAPLPVWNFQGTWPLGLRRLRYAGRSPAYGFFAGYGVCLLAGTALSLPALVGFLHLPLFPAVGAALAGGLFFAAFASFCGTASATAAGCGCLSFFLSAASLLASGGIIPPVLLPEAVRRLGELSPIAWLRTMAAYGLGHDCPPGVIGAWAVSAALLTAIACRLYCQRMKAAVEP